MSKRKNKNTFNLYNEIFRKHKIFQLKPDTLNINSKISKCHSKISSMLTLNRLLLPKTPSTSPPILLTTPCSNLTTHYPKPTSPFKHLQTKHKSSLTSPTVNKSTDFTLPLSSSSFKPHHSFSKNTSPSKPFHLSTTTSFYITSPSKFKLTSSQTINNTSTPFSLSTIHNKKRNKKSNTTLTWNDISRSQTILHTITNECVNEVKKGEDINTVINVKYKRNKTLMRFFPKGNLQDRNALTEDNERYQWNLNNKKAIKCDIDHVDKLSSDIVFKNKMLYINSINVEKEEKGYALFSVSGKKNYLENKNEFIKEFRSKQTQKEFEMIQRLVGLNDKRKSEFDKKWNKLRLKSV